MSNFYRRISRLVNTCWSVICRYKKIDFFEYVRRERSERQRLGQFSTAEKYFTALQHLIRFHGSPHLNLRNIDAAMIKQFEEYLKQRGLSSNSISAYMRSLSSCYNRAVKHYHLQNRQPFHDVYTGVAKTRKRAVSLTVIRQMADLDLSPWPQESFVRDIFLFSFFMRGMSLVDILFLTRENLNGRYVTYTRRKTGQQFVVYIEGPAWRILLRNAKASTGRYLFPVVTATDSAEKYKQYRRFLSTYNRLLGCIGKRLDYSGRITGYVARHSWATIARDSGISTSVISSALGHTGEGTTQIYLDDMKNTVVDTANHKIVSLFRRLGVNK